jgi:CheY-like chemotaxis protein
MDIHETTLVLIEDDAANLEALQMVLSDEQYQTLTAMTLHHALHLLDTEDYHLVVSDLFGENPDERGHNALLIQEHALPAPVGILTARVVAQEAPTLQTFAFALNKPYDIEVLLTSIADCLNIPLPPTALPQAASIAQFFASLNVHNWEAVLELCTEDIVYYSPYAGEVKGKTAYRTYMEPRTRQFPDVHLTPLKPLCDAYGLGCAVSCDLARASRD